MVGRGKGSGSKRARSERDSDEESVQSTESKVKQYKADEDQEPIVSYCALVRGIRHNAELSEPSEAAEFPNVDLKDDSCVYLAPSEAALQSMLRRHILDRLVSAEPFGSELMTYRDSEPYDSSRIEDFRDRKMMKIAKKLFIRREDNYYFRQDTTADVEFDVQKMNDILNKWYSEEQEIVFVGVRASVLIKGLIAPEVECT